MVMTTRHANKTEAMAMSMSMAIPTLPNEVIAEILSRLPVKSLGQFRCVSKPWLSLLSDPHFIKMHLKQKLSHKLFMYFMFCSKKFKIQSLDYEALVSGDDDEKSAGKNLQLPVAMGSLRGVRILGSCNGLLCLGIGDNDIIMWNPCIGEYKRLQEASGLGSYGFGYDCCNDDYKLVKVIPRNGSDEIGVDVFSLKTNSWKRVCYGGHSFDLVDDVGTLLNGSVYWQAKREDTKETKFIIVSFDLVKEKFRELPKPDSKFAEGPLLGVLGESLCACRSLFGKNVEVWAMKEEGAEVSWIKFATVLLEMEPEYIREYSVPLCFAKNGEAIMLKGGLQLDAYNLKENGYRRIYISPIGQYEFDGTVYVESLVSPNAYDGAHSQSPRIGENAQEKVEE
nr:F-box/kelch-repeat protein At3g06240-like [Quercus suber]XP_023928361.1 F-box/kelch-repeat protein At3g06240-like [Quercus suber]